jgi:predicted protein tyrosine phosphatase
MNILFVCSKNRWRSRTAETIFKNSQNHTVKSAGTSRNARVKLNENHLIQADLVFVLEQIYGRRIDFDYQSLSGKFRRRFSLNSAYLHIYDKLLTFSTHQNCK